MKNKIIIQISLTIIMLTALSFAMDLTQLSKNLESDATQRIKRAHGISAVEAFIWGFWTPQYSNMYYIPSLITLTKTVKGVLWVESLDKKIHKKSIIDSSCSYTKLLLKNLYFYTTGFGMRYLIARALYSHKNKWFQWAISLPNISLTVFMIGFFHYLFRFITYNPTLFSTTAHCLYAAQNVKEFKDVLEKEGYTIDDFVSKYKVNIVYNALLDKNDTLKNNIVEYYTTYPDKLLKSATPFVVAIAYNDQVLLKDLLSIVKSTHSQDKKKTRMLIDSFCKTVKEVIDAIEKAKLSSICLKYQQNLIANGYALLEEYFKIIQKVGHNPYSLNDDTAVTPVIRLLKCYSISQLRRSNLQLATADQFLEKVIHYFIEMGVPLYKHTNAKFPNDDTGWVVRWLARICNYSKQDERTPFTAAEHNPLLQDYFKLIARYNKTLLNYNHQLINVSTFQGFFTDLSDEQQQLIFNVAATRGHLKTINALNVIDSNKYSLKAAMKMAIDRRLYGIVCKYIAELEYNEEHITLMYESLTNDEDKFFFNTVKQDLEQTNDALIKFCGSNIEEVIQPFKEVIKKADAQRFSRMMQELRNHKKSDLDDVD